MANTFVSDAGFESTLPAQATASAPSGIAGILKAIADRMTMAHQRRVDADVGQFIEQHGGQLTDEIERQISRRFGTHSGQW